MKKNNIAKIVILGVLMIFSLFGCKKPVQISDIKSFYFTYGTSGSVADASVGYTLEYKDGAYTAAIKPDGVSEEQREYYQVDEVFADRLEKFLRDNGVGKWHGFDRSDKNAMDGTGFTLSIYMQDDTELSAHGYMKWPENYAAVRDGIDDIFSALRE